jgi:hypothetical protein
MADMLRRRNRILIYQTQYSKQPLSGANYAYVRRTMKMLLLAQHELADQALLNEDPSEEELLAVPFGVNWTTGQLDPDTRGLILIPDDQESKNWIKNKVLTLQHEGCQFRAWDLDEQPAEYCYELYLSDDYNCMDDDKALALLHKLNPQLPATDYNVDSVTDMTDKREFNKGRLFKLKAGAAFHQYLTSKNFTLKYAGDLVSCIEAGEKQRQADRKKAAAAASRPNQGQGKPGSGNGYGKKPRN